MEDRSRRLADREGELVAVLQERLLVDSDRAHDVQLCTGPRRAARRERRDRAVETLVGLDEADGDEHELVGGQPQRHPRVVTVDGGVGHEARAVGHDGRVVLRDRPDRKEPVALDCRVEDELVDGSPHACGETAVAPSVSQRLVVELVDDNLARVRESERHHETGRADGVISRRDTDAEEHVGVELHDEPVEPAHSSGERRRTASIAQIQPLVRG